MNEGHLFVMDGAVVNNNAHFQAELMFIYRSRLGPPGTSKEIVHFGTVVPYFI